MPGRRKDKLGEQNKQQEREDHILDVAAELLQRWGYKKTTIDDIAKYAGVAKGTIYLHWKARDELFMDLLLREKTRASEAIQQAVKDDPEGMTLHTLAKYTLLAAYQYPLFKALLLNDTNVLGDIQEKAKSISGMQEVIESFSNLVNDQREKGLIRTNLPVKTQVQMLQAMLIGYITVDRYLPADYQLGIEESPERIADVVKRALAICGTIPEEKSE